MNRTGWHLTWPLLSDAIRAARQALEDDDWHGLDTRPAAARMAGLQWAYDRGGRYVPPF